MAQAPKTHRQSVVVPGTTSIPAAPASPNKTARVFSILYQATMIVSPSTLSDGRDRRSARAPTGENKESIQRARDLSDRASDSGPRCGTVFLKAMEQRVRAEQEDRQQAIDEIGTPCGLVITHFAAIPVSGETAAQLFVADFESSASTPAAQARTNE